MRVTTAVRNQPMTLPDKEADDPELDSVEPCDAFELLACPVDGSNLTHDRGWLVSAAGRRYPIVQGVAVLLRDDVDHTIALTRQSLAWAHRWAEGDRTDSFFIETLGISSKQRDEVRALVADDGPRTIDIVVTYLVAATNGTLYKHLIGRLDTVPIPECRMAAVNGVELLDVGCSWGRWSLAAARQGYQPIGIDPSLGAVLAAKRVAQKRGVAFRGVVGDARDLPFKPGAVGAAFSYSVLQHFSKADAELALRQIARVVVPGGPVRIQMAASTGLRSMQKIAQRGIRAPQDFEVRYWSPFRLMRVFREIFTDARLEVDCYFGLGLQPTDRALYGRTGRMILSASEAMRSASAGFPPLRYLADSVYLVGKA